MVSYIFRTLAGDWNGDESAPTHPSPPSDVDFIIVGRDGDIVEMWMRRGAPGHDLARRLRVIADGFETGHDVRRIR